MKTFTFAILIWHCNYQMSAGWTKHLQGKASVDWLSILLSRAPVDRIDRYDRQLFDRHNQLLLSKAPFDRIDRYDRQSGDQHNQLLMKKDRHRNDRLSWFCESNVQNRHDRYLSIKSCRINRLFHTVPLCVAGGATDSTRVYQFSTYFSSFLVQFLNVSILQHVVCNKVSEWYYTICIFFGFKLG